MVTRLIDYLKAGQITSLFTSLTQGGNTLVFRNRRERKRLIVHQRARKHPLHGAASRRSVGPTGTEKESTRRRQQEAYGVAEVRKFRSHCC